MLTLSQIKKLCIEADGQEIESARDHVVASHIPGLIRFYWELDDWPAKHAVVQLLQDHESDDLRPVMLDVLRAPDVDNWFQDSVELSKIVALGFVDEKYDTFTAFYNNRLRLRTVVLDVLAEHKMVQEPPVTTVKAEVELTPPAGLLDAIQAGNLDEVRRWIALGESPNQFIEDGNKKGCTYLMEAIMQDQFDVAWLLLEAGADAKMRRKDSKQTALTFAASRNRLRLCLRLMDSGADPDDLDDWGGSVVQTAAQYGYLELLDATIERGGSINQLYHDGRNAIWFAADGGQIESVMKLLDAGVPINALASDSAPLHLASRNNSIGLVKALIARGADLNVVTLISGFTPLMLAAKKGNSSVIKHLLKAGADPTLVDKSGTRAVDMATGRRGDAVREAFESFAG